MKRAYSILCCTLALFVASCSLDRDPYDAIDAASVFDDPGSLEAATLGNYALMKGQYGYSGWADELHRIAEYPGDNVALSGATTDPLFFIYNYKAITRNGRVDRFWSTSYKIAVGANLIAEQIEEGTSEVSDQLLGENLYLRGLIYFQMGNVFGRPYNQGTENLSVPLKLSSDTEDRPDRNTVGEVYDQVIADLTRAEQLMTINKGAPYASKPAAQALLSRVYLYMEDNQRAIDYADLVINSEEYALLSNDRFQIMNTLTPDQNEEAIFSVALSNVSDLPSPWMHYSMVGSMYATIEGAGWGEMYASSTYLDLLREHPADARSAFIVPQYLYEDGNRIPAVYLVNQETLMYEFRRTTERNGTITFEEDGQIVQLQSELDDEGDMVYYFEGPSGRQEVVYDFDMEKRNGYPKFFVTKASLQQNDRHFWSPTVSRLAEMYLNKAEAYAKLGDDEQAIENVNIIRERAGIPLYEAGNLPAGMSVLDVVLQERRLELAFEGHRRFDVYRNGRTMDRSYPGTHLINNDPLLYIEATHPRVIEYIPEQQILLQPSLVQNE